MIPNKYLENDIYGKFLDVDLPVINIQKHKNDNIRNNILKQSVSCDTACLEKKKKGNMLLNNQLDLLNSINEPSDKMSYINNLNHTEILNSKGLGCISLSELYDNYTLNSVSKSINKGTKCNKKGYGSLL